MYNFLKFHQRKCCHSNKSCLIAAHNGYESIVAAPRTLHVPPLKVKGSIRAPLSLEDCDYRFNWVLKTVPVSWAINLIEWKNFHANFHFHWVSKNMYRNELFFLDFVLTFFTLLKMYLISKFHKFFANKFCLIWQQD